MFVPLFVPVQNNPCHLPEQCTCALCNCACKVCHPVARPRGRATKQLKLLVIEMVEMALIQYNITKSTKSLMSQKAIP